MRKDEMSLITGKINNILKGKNLTRYQLSKLIDFNESSLNHMINGNRPFTDESLDKLLPILEILREDFDGWIVADKYPKEVIELAIQAKEEKSRVCHSRLDPESHEILHSSSTHLVSIRRFGSSAKGLNRVQDDKKEKLILTIKIDEILKQKGLSRTKLAKQINHSQSGLNRVIIGKEPLSKGVIQKLIPALEVSENIIKSWVVADKYKIEVLQNALKELS